MIEFQKYWKLRHSNFTKCKRLWFWAQLEILVIKIIDIIRCTLSSQLNYSKYFKDDFSYQYYLRKCHVSRYLFTNYHSTYLWHSLKYLIGYRNWQRNVGIYPLEKLRFNEMFISQEMKNSFRLWNVRSNWIILVDQNCYRNLSISRLYRLVSFFSQSTI